MVRTVLARRKSDRRLFIITGDKTKDEMLKDVRSKGYGILKMWSGIPTRATIDKWIKDNRSGKNENLK